eukprot:m.129486 g.129486  ORF g.129486 m.129486 type:complete len:50 (+) comp37978_c0_seq1:79-228(+)
MHFLTKGVSVLYVFYNFILTSNINHPFFSQLLDWIDEQLMYMFSVLTRF